MSEFETIQSLLGRRAELRSRLALLPYEGTPEIKRLSSGRYLYVRKRVLNKVTSTYVGPYSDELFNLLLRNNEERKLLSKQLRGVEKELARLGYEEADLSPKVVLNLEYARSNMKRIIYDQAVLEGIGTTFPDTETIIENGKVSNATAEDVQKILNLKHAWEFVLDKDVLAAPSNYYLACYIAKLVNEGFYREGGRIRYVPVTIGGTSYVPPLPLESEVRRAIDAIAQGDGAKEDIAIELLLYVMKTQIYNDGNKRTALIFANHYMISNGLGLLIIPFDKVGEFKKMLVAYYEGRDEGATRSFLKSCINKL